VRLEHVFDDVKDAARRDPVVSGVILEVVVRDVLDVDLRHCVSITEEETVVVLDGDDLTIHDLLREAGAEGDRVTDLQT
jgi:hypothetical protein